MFSLRFPIIDNDILTANLEELIRTGPLKNVDVLIGVTADEALYFAEEHIFNHYLPGQYRTNPTLTTTKTNDINSISSTTKKSIDNDPPQGFSFFRKNRYIRNYLKTNYPEHLCYYDQIHKHYMPTKANRHNLTETAQLYTNLVS